MPNKAVPSGLAERLALMSFLAAICVVSIHVSHLRILRSAIAGNDGLLSDWVAYFLEWLLSIGLGSSAVPFFFLLSGVFLSRHYGEPHWYLDAVKKRARSVVVPYVMFSLFDFLLVRQGTVVNVLGLNLWEFPRVGAYWYLRALFLFVVFSGFCFPVFRRVISHVKLMHVLCGGYFICVCLRMIYVYFTLHDLYFWLVLNTCRGFVYFLCGYSLSVLSAIVVGKMFKRVIVWLFLVLLIGSFGFSLIHVNPYLHGFVSESLIPCGIMTAWILIPNLPHIQVTQLLRKTSFAIYMLHPIIAITIFGPCITAHFPRELERYGLCMIVGVFVPMLVKSLMDRFCRGFSMVLFGGR